MRRLLAALWPTLVWMGVVFTMSTSVGSPVHSDGIIQPLLRWLDPGISAAAIERAEFLGRKAGHITEYAVLAVLILRSLSLLRAPLSRWSWRLAAIALGASAAYGATDEFHQRFVATRGPSVHDVFIDAGGALVGLTLAFLWQRRTAARVVPAVN